MLNSKRAIAFFALVFLGGVVLVDLAVSQPPNPYAQPPLFALGSGQAASGAMCATVPSGN